MWMFIAGAIKTGAWVAIRTVVNKSSAIPLAILPITLAVAGAMTKRSALSARLMCPISDSWVRLNDFSGNRMTGKGLKSQRRHELHGAPGHDNLDIESGFNQQSDQLDGFVTRNPAGHAEDHDSLFFGSATK